MFAELEEELEEEDDPEAFDPELPCPPVVVVVIVVLVVPLLDEFPPVFDPCPEVPPVVMVVTGFWVPFEVLVVVVTVVTVVEASEDDCCWIKEIGTPLIVPMFNPPP